MTIGRQNNVRLLNPVTLPHFFACATLRCMPWISYTDGTPQAWQAPTPDRAARVLAERHAGTLRYCHDAKRWFVWDSVLWRRDCSEHVLLRIRAIARELGTDPEGLVGRNTGGVTFIAGAERLARSEPALAATAKTWDADPWSLGTPGGSVDLRVRRSEPSEAQAEPRALSVPAPAAHDNGPNDLLPADPVHGITRATAVAPSDTATCPIWLRFLDETFGGDAELIGFIQRFCGYALTGATAEQGLVYGWGPGGNGKSVFLNTLLGVLSDYARPATFAALVSNDRARYGADLAALRGVRLVGVAESDGVWSERRLKLITGGDAVPLPGGGVFRPCCKLLVMGNAPPALASVNGAIGRRLRVVPFRYSPEHADRHLDDKLRAEWPGVLRWMIEGCRLWQAHGLGRPAAVVAATIDVLEGQDPIGQFLLECCEGSPDDCSRSVTAGDVFAAWHVWATAAGEPVGTQRAFAAALVERGFARERTNCTRLYRGLSLRD
ncbi:phage/plasmid primase, P4 family [Beijerinckia sp. L45]|uniref:phage/plasmid primase, P4 family n=1 Tax=Beijerinckia sp. L45 TaxID=1641855 RepID=UPI001AED92D1|nr:phage/plasmid primase, P4 family [Beijerinckia sp. L45]